ncbi:uncharacterized protein LOC144872293 [Branchiostoma floridae x Branchiostoma japonicum]
MLDITQHAPVGYYRSHQTEARRTGGKVKNRLTHTRDFFIIFIMNWVGGARSRLRMKYEKKQQKDYFERKRYARQVKTVRPLSPGARHRKGGISQDLLYLQTLNTAHSMDRTGTVSASSSRQVNKVDLSKTGGSFPLRRQEDLELPNMSPDYSKTPSSLQLAGPADSKPPCQHYLSYDDWITSSSGKLGNDTSDSEVHLFDQSGRLSEVAPHTSNTNRELQSQGTPFVPYTTPGPKAFFKDPFRKFTSSSSLVKFEEGPHTPDLRQDHDLDPEVMGIGNPPRTPGSCRKRRKLARTPSSGRSVRTPSTFSSSSPSSIGSPVGADTQDKTHEEEHRPILLHQSERPSLHSWLSSISRDAETPDIQPDKTTPSTTDGETLPAGKRRKLDFGQPCSTYAIQQRAAMSCSDSHAQPPVGKDLNINTWDASYIKEATVKKFTMKPETPSTIVKQNTDQTTDKTKGYQATLQNLMSMPLTWANQQPTDHESKEKKGSSVVAEDGFPAATQQFAPGSAPRTGLVAEASQAASLPSETGAEFTTPKKETAKRICNGDRDTHQKEVSTPHIRDPFSPLSSQESVCFSSGVESLSSLDLSEASQEQDVNLSQEELQSLEEALSDPQSTLKGVPKTDAEVNHNADTSGVEKDVSDCIQLLLTLVEFGSFSGDAEHANISPETNLPEDPAISPMTTPKRIPVQDEPTALAGSENTSLVESVSCHIHPTSTSKLGPDQDIATELVGSENTSVVESCQGLDCQATLPTAHSRWIPNQVEATKFVLSEDTAVVNSLSCQGSIEEMSHFTESEVLVKEVIDSIIRDVTDRKILTEGEQQHKTVHIEETPKGQGIVAMEQDNAKTDASESPPPNVSKELERTSTEQQQQHKTIQNAETGEEQEVIARQQDNEKTNGSKSASPPENVSKQFHTESLKEQAQKDQETQIVTSPEMQTAASTNKSETEMSVEDEQDSCGSLSKSSSRCDKWTQTPDEEGSFLGEESASAGDECEQKARAVLDKVRGLPEACRSEERLLTMLNEVEELVVKLESAHILQSLKEGTSA